MGSLTIDISLLRKCTASLVVNVSFVSKILAVKAGTYIEPSSRPCWPYFLPQPTYLVSPIALLLPVASAIVEVDFLQTYISYISMNLNEASFRVAGVKVYPRQTWNFSPCSICMHWPVVSRAIHALHAIEISSLSMYMHASGCFACMCHHGPSTWLLHALTAWDLKFQACLGYTFIPTTIS